jgi:TonB family protein
MNFSRRLSTGAALGTAAAAANKRAVSALLLVLLGCDAATVAPKPLHTSVSVSLPRYGSKPSIEDYFPTASRSQKEQGTTKIKLCYDDLGRPTSSMVEESSSFARLDEAALRWSRAVRIIPGSIGGQPHSGCVIIPVTFSLEKSQDPPDQENGTLTPAPPPTVVDPPVAPRQPSGPARLIPLGGKAL